MTTWINGQLATHIEVSDRALNYGDGIFTTILVKDRECRDLTAHLVRLQQGIKILEIAQIDFAALAQQLAEIAKEHSIAVLKVLVSRGSGQRGYSCVGCDDPKVIVTLSDYPSHYLAFQAQGIALGVSTVALGLNPLLAGIKHLNRLEQVLIRQQIDKENQSDALVLDCQGFIVETAVANVFWVKDNIVYTPSLDLSGVSGIMRDNVIKCLTEQGFQVQSDRYRLGSVISADEVFITNCLLGMVRVTSIGDAQYSDNKVFTLVDKLINHE